MDMQTRVVFKINKGADFIDEREALLSEKGALGLCGIQIKEQQEAWVYFFSDDHEAMLEIECYDSMEEPRRLKPGEKAMVNSRELDDTLVPGDYLVSVSADGKEYEGLYQIIPSNLSWQGLANLREYLESILTGLSYDLYSRRTGAVGDSLFDGSPSAQKIYQRVESEYDNILNNLNRIIDNPISDISGEHKELPYSKRPDARSQRWLSGKGLSRNTNASAPSIFFEKKIVTTLDNIENCWIKKIIYRIQTILRSLETNFSLGYEARLERYNDMKAELSETEDKISKTSNNWSTEKTYKYYNDRKRIIEGEMADISHKMEAINESRERIRNIIGNLSRFQYETWLKDLPLNLRVRKPTLRLIRDKRYSYLYRLYKELTSLQRNELSKEKVTFPYKKTSLLFEYYTLALVIRTLEESGYQWTKGWLADQEDDGFSMIGDLESDTMLTFENEGSIIEVSYDTEIMDRVTSYDKSEFILNYIKKPDIRIASFDRDGNLKGAMILEVKCRKFSNLYSADYDTDAMKQIKDYGFIMYYNARARRKEAAIEKIVVPVPKQYSIQEVKRTQDNIIFIPLEPSKPGEIPSGYEELKKEILEVVSR